MNFLRLFAKPRPTPVQYVMRDICRLSIEEWRSVPELVSQAAKYLRDPSFRVMLDVLANGDPATDAPQYTNIPLEQRAVQQARTEGYRMALRRLELLAVPYEPQEPIEATFERPTKYE